MVSNHIGFNRNDVVVKWTAFKWVHHDVGMEVAVLFCYGNPVHSRRANWSGELPDYLDVGHDYTGSIAIVRTRGDSNKLKAV